MENGINLELYNVPSKKDLIHFVEKHTEKNVREGLKENTERWIEELNILYKGFTGEPIHSFGNAEHLSGMTPTDIKDDEGLEKLDDDVFLYRGEKPRMRGLWIREKREKLKMNCEIVEEDSWTRHSIGSSAELRLRKGYNDLDEDVFLPENFTERAEIVKENKRPIMTFPIERNDNEEIIYAKGAATGISYIHEPPSYRLTSLAGVSRTTSEKEMKTALELKQKGVKVPEVIGYYESLAEEFLFLERIKGKNPSEFIDSDKKKIIQKDAEMLANLHRAGYHKTGFSDFDDKLFDGEELYLVDFDETKDIFNLMGMNYEDLRENMKDPTEKEKWKEFRNRQANLFNDLLTDALDSYKGSLLTSEEDRRKYIEAYGNQAGWSELKEEKMREIMPERDHTSFDSYLAMIKE